MKRYKNYGLWLSALSFIPFLADGLKVYDINLILPGNYDALVKAFLGILVLAGVISNPTTANKGFLDDKR